MKTIQLAVALLLSSAICMAQNNRKLNLTVGQKFTVVSDMDIKSLTTAMGQEVENDMTVGTSYDLTVDNLSNDVYTLTGTLTMMKTLMKMMGQEMKYDSRDSVQNSPMAASVEEVLNKPMKIRITTGGKILESDSTDQNLSSIMRQLQSSASGGREAFLALPAKVKVGDTFTVTENNDNAGTTSEVQYKVEKIDGNMATLSFNGTTKTDQEMEEQGMQVHAVTSGKITGESVVNVQTGVVQTSKINIKSSGNMSVMGQEMPTQSDVHSTVTVTAKK